MKPARPPLPIQTADAAVKCNDPVATQALPTSIIEHVAVLCCVASEQEQQLVTLTSCVLASCDNLTWRGAYLFLISCLHASISIAQLQHSLSLTARALATDSCWYAFDREGLLHGMYHPPCSSLCNFLCTGNAPNACHGRLW